MADTLTTAMRLGAAALVLWAGVSTGHLGVGLLAVIVAVSLAPEPDFEED